MATHIWTGATDGDFGTAGNWDVAAVPGTSDIAVIPANATVAIDGGDEAIIDKFITEPGCSVAIGSTGTPLDLDFSSETNASLDLAGIGTTYLKITEAKAVRVGAAAVAPGVGQFGLNIESISTTNNPTLDIVCPADTHSVGVAGVGGDTAEFASINVTGGSVTIGNRAAGVSSVQESDGSADPDIKVRGGGVTCYTDVGAVVLSGGTMTQEAGTTTSLTTSGGTYNDNSTGTVSAILASGATTFDYRGSLEAKTVSACDIGTGVSIHDPNGRVTWTAGIDLIRCGVQDVTLDLGDHIRITRGSVA